jgi:hypothetical protein
VLVAALKTIFRANRLLVLVVVGLYISLVYIYFEDLKRYLYDILDMIVSTALYELLVPILGIPIIFIIGLSKIWQYKNDTNCQVMQFIAWCAFLSPLWIFIMIKIIY